MFSGLGDTRQNLLLLVMEGMPMACLLLTDNAWELIADVFPEPAPTDRPRRDARMVLAELLITADNATLEVESF